MTWESLKKEVLVGYDNGTTRRNDQQVQEAPIGENGGQFQALRIANSTQTFAGGEGGMIMLLVHRSLLGESLTQSSCM